MTEIMTAEIERIAINPFRRLHNYPYIQSKLDALDRSIEEVGLWPSIIARPLGDHKLWKYEIAFGHHRLEAAKRRGLKEIPLILEKLSDKEMLQYMGRENLEDYNANFLIQLESWEAAAKSGLATSSRDEVRPQAIDIAKLLGWTDSSKEGYTKLNKTARACHAAYSLLVGGHMGREDFREQTVDSAFNIAERAYAKMRQIEEAGKKHGYTARDIEIDKKKVAAGARDTAQQVRENKVAPRDVRRRVDFNTAARIGSRPSPLFAVFANEVADNLKRTLNTDANAEKLTNIEKALELISMVEDAAALRRLKVELINLSERANAWDARLEPSTEKVVQLRALEHKGRAS